MNTKWHLRLALLLFAAAIVAQSRAATPAPVPAPEPGAPIIIAIAPTNLTPATHRAASAPAEAPVAYVADYAPRDALSIDGRPRIVSGPGAPDPEALPVQEPTAWGRYRTSARPWRHFERFPGIR